MSSQEPGIGTLLSKIGHDFRTIVADETALGHAAIAYELKYSIEKIAIALLGAFVALIGFALLCVTAVIALEPVVTELWIRTLIMSVAYMIIGGLGIWRVAKYHAKVRVPFEQVVGDARATVKAVTDGLKH